MKLYKILSLILFFSLINCNSSITNNEDYSTYIQTKPNFDQSFASVDFWTNKLNKNPNQYPYLVKRASAYTKLFNQKGEISYLIKAEKDLANANIVTKEKNVGYLRSLASNYISQHRFKEALDLLNKAKSIGDELLSTRKMLFDTHMELGNYIEAEAYLKDIKNPSDFDYRIRLAKWEDHQGNLEGAVVQMEEAMKIAESSNLKSLKQWSYTNIADFYGHAGKIEKSYNYYLKALELDPNDAYAKKGIAWILYSYENKPDEALAILNHVSDYYSAPDYNLLVADIASYTGDMETKNRKLTDYQNAVRNNAYGAMYNKYNVLVYTEELLLPELAVEIAKEEVQNRPTPESYDLLAWSYFQMGNQQKAKQIIDAYVIGKTSEPDVLYHIAEIQKANGELESVKSIKPELLASLYELGPTMKQKIRNL
ncbi:tetratricopeptide repeat protein [Winogradskyella vincentii]|uniref:Cell surface protein n=1 Tax=Winogradskyella vincentii TaxID=2877122 RepID=A0ABS7Y0M1_9FLAO|nr:cell surface protein [Winogradskyella vincentii]MCA0153475.1 cell surface protein [Winogradskyella vincentii]